MLEEESERRETTKVIRQIYGLRECFGYFELKTPEIGNHVGQTIIVEQRASWLILFITLYLSLLFFLILLIAGITSASLLLG